MGDAGARLVRIGELGRAEIPLRIDGIACTACTDDTVLVAVLTNGAALRAAEFGDGQRAGFCLMGACQDCWMWTREGERLRACTTTVARGMDLLTHAPEEAAWPNQA